MRSARPVVSLLVVSLGLLACGRSTPTEPTVNGRLVLETRLDASSTTCSLPPATVLVDGREVGQLPYPGRLVVEVPPGDHTWTLGTGGGLRSFSVRAGQDHSIVLAGTCLPR